MANRIYARRVSLVEPVKRQLIELYERPIAKEDEERFKRYFRKDINETTFTANEFRKFFKVGPTLSKRLLAICGCSDAYEMNKIPGSDVVRMARLLWNSSTADKALILFKLFDENNDEKVSLDEIRVFYEETLAECNQIFTSSEQVNEVVNVFLQAFFQKVNSVENNELTFSEFYTNLEKHPDVLKSLYLIGIPDNDACDEMEMIWYQRWMMYIRNNVNRFIFIILYILLLISLMIYVIIYRGLILKSSVWQVIARIGGIWINIDFAIAITLELKTLMTIIRREQYLRFLIPVDDHIDAHRLVGTHLFIASIIHTVGHTTYFATHTEKHSLIESLFTQAAGVGWVAHLAPLTGVILLIFLIVMFICALQCIRERPGFYKVFRYTHLLYFPIFILLIIHATEFWKWVIGPMFLFFFEKIYFLKRYLPRYGRTRLISVQIEDENVITLNIERPRSFRFSTGDYINLCLPNISRTEWHPFTISSGVKQNDLIRINIKKKKNWTKKVYDYFHQRLSNNNIEVRVDNQHNQSDTNFKNIRQRQKIEFSGDEKDSVACIEGPFSSCTCYIFDCEHAVLIGAGIGITPFICALESLIYRIKKQRCICSNCGTRNYFQENLSKQKLKKVDFIWICRDVGDFSWFQHVLDDFEKEQNFYMESLSSTNHSQTQPSRYLDIHLYCTSLQRNDQAMLENLPYNLVASMYAAVHDQDMHTQLQTRTNIGRPPWRLLLAKFKTENQTTNVFFTGNAAMGDEIKRLCDGFGFPFRREPGF